MPSLREVCADSTVVVLDAASDLVQVGRFEPGAPARWETSPEEAGVAIFRCFAALDLDVGKVGAWAFCDGPGSILGIRTTAIALRTWSVGRRRPIFAYSCLAVVAHALGQPDLGVIVDARRETWHHYELGRGLRRVPTAQLAGRLAMPAPFRHWSALPAGVARVPYTLAQLLPQVWDAELLRPTDAPDAFLHEEPRYVTWTPQIHRAPG
ncbi:MAG: peptidase M22 [Verrucomicrobia bacterium]|nr:peptidase M22 [Verrucomicrobiota bacterium]